MYFFILQHQHLRTVVLNHRAWNSHRLFSRLFHPGKGHDCNASSLMKVIVVYLMMVLVLSAAVSYRCCECRGLAGLELLSADRELARFMLSGSVKSTSVGRWAEWRPARRLNSRAEERLNDSRSFEKLALRGTAPQSCPRVMQFTLHFVSNIKLMGIK